MYAQNFSPKDSLWTRIQYRDSMMDRVNKKELTDSLWKQNEDYSLLTRILMQEVNAYSVENLNLKNELHKYNILTSPDTLVFHQDFTTFYEIPLCLKERADLVNSIIELRKRISSTESTALYLEKTLGNSPVAYAAIREKIEKDLDGIQTLIHKIKSMNISSLSTEQQKYFRPGLTERYNNFKKYY